MFLRRFCYAFLLIFAVYFSSLWFLYLVISPILGDGFIDDLDVLGLGGVFGPTGILFKKEGYQPNSASRWFDEVALVEIVDSLGLEEEVDEVMNVIGMSYSYKDLQKSAGEERKRRNRTADERLKIQLEEAKKREIKKSGGVGGGNGASSSSGSNKATSSHPSNIKQSHQDDPLDDVGSQDYSEYLKSTASRYGSATASNSNENVPSEEIYGYEQRRYSKILRHALTAVRYRRYSTAKALLLRCSDPNKKPIELKRKEYMKSKSQQSRRKAQQGLDSKNIMGEKDYKVNSPEESAIKEQKREGEVPIEEQGSHFVGERKSEMVTTSSTSSSSESGSYSSGNENIITTSIYDPYCVNKLGEYYLAGFLFQKDYSKAIDLFVEAAAVGNEEAQFNLGILFASSVSEDPHYAILHRAVMRGHGVEQQNRQYQYQNSNTNSNGKYERGSESSCNANSGNNNHKCDAIDKHLENPDSGTQQQQTESSSSPSSSSSSSENSKSTTVFPTASAEALSVLYLYAASTAGHPGALMAMAHRSDQGLGVPKICSTAALNYIEVAKSITEIYSSGMPQAVELIRLNLDFKKNKKMMTASEISLFTQIARQGDVSVAAAIGKRYLLGIDGFQQNYARAHEYLKMSIENSEQQANSGSDGKDGSSESGKSGHGGSLGLLGYMYALGLGVEKNLETAHEFFSAASLEGDALGKNGLGFIYFHGTKDQERDFAQAYHYFNESAILGSADGMFNLASVYLTGVGVDSQFFISILLQVYLTGVGVDQSFQKAVLWYTQALDRGHTPAAYSLAVMHLNGVGTVRDCSIATNLLKRVSERGSWVSSRLQDAYSFSQTVDYDASADNYGSGGVINLVMKFLNTISFGIIPDANYVTGGTSGFANSLLSSTTHLQAGLDSMGRDGSSLEVESDAVDLNEPIDVTSGKVYEPLVVIDMAALLFLQLAESGHEVAQSNVAHLFDQGYVGLLSSHPAFKRFYAQRYYELSADQGSASSELRLGDYAYSGWGRKIISSSEGNTNSNKQKSSNQKGQSGPGPNGPWELQDQNSVYSSLNQLGDDLITAEELDLYQRMGVNITAFKDKVSQGQQHQQHLLKEPNEEILLKTAEVRAQAEAQNGISKNNNQQPVASNSGSSTGTSSSKSSGTSSQAADVNSQEQQDNHAVDYPQYVDQFEHLFHTHPEELVARYSEAADLETAAAHYWKVSQMSVTGEWTQQFVARASFNLGIMYQFGLGTLADLNLARKLYKRCIEIDPATVQTPINLVLFGLTAHQELLNWQKVDWQAVRKEIFSDARAHVLFLAIVVFIILLRLRFQIFDRRDQLLVEIRRRRDTWRSVEKLLMIEYKKYEGMREEERSNQKNADTSDLGSEKEILKGLSSDKEALTSQLSIKSSKSENQNQNTDSNNKDLKLNLSTPTKKDKSESGSAEHLSNTAITLDADSPIGPGSDAGVSPKGKINIGGQSNRGPDSSSSSTSCTKKECCPSQTTQNQTQSRSKSSQAEGFEDIDRDSEGIDIRSPSRSPDRANGNVNSLSSPKNTTKTEVKQEKKEESGGAAGYQLGGNNDSGGMGRLVDGN